MRPKWSHLISPFVAATLFGCLYSFIDWVQLRTALLTVLSVMAAGVLVRLARGMPFTNTTSFNLEFAEKVASAVKHSIRTLRALLIVIFITMGLITFSSTLVSVLFWLAAFFDVGKEYVLPFFSFVAGWFLTYVVIRVFSVASSDVSLADMQADMVIDQARKKQTDDFLPVLEAHRKEPLTNPLNYGKVIQ
jgi:hypothetical protein